MLRTFEELNDVLEVDRRRYDRDIERAYFTAWCTEMFARQSRLDQWDVALKKLRSARQTRVVDQPVVDWRIERDQMQAIRDRHAAADPEKKGKKAK